MPRRHKCVKRVPAYVNNLCVRFSDGVSQRSKRDVGSKESWLIIRRVDVGGEIRNLVVCIKLVLKERHKVMRVGSEQRVAL